MRRVAVTGIGLLTPLGTGVEETWNGLVAGRSAVGPIGAYDASSLRTRIGAELAGFEPTDFASPRTLRTMTRNDQLALAGATLAVRDSGLDLAAEDGERIGLFVGSNKEISNPDHVLEGALVARTEEGTVDIHRLGERAASAFYPLFYVEGLQAASLFYVSQAYGLKGANTYFAGMAEAGATAVGRAYRAVRRGEAEIALAGGFDDAISWWNMTKFDALGVLTGRNELGAGACRPWDRDRDGGVLGEGSAFLVLEDAGAARRRGARVYAEVAGVGSRQDTYGLVTPDPEGRALARAVEAALEEAGSEPGSVGFVAAHGSGTRRGDASEAAALSSVFDSDGGLAASSVKAATGDLVAGAGALNVAVAALALYHRIVPPTLNLEHPDPPFAAGWARAEASEEPLTEALALARGLEGQNVAVALRAAS